MRLVVAGLGSACLRAHLPAIVRLQAIGKVTLAGLADPDPGRRAMTAARLPDVPTFASAEEMLAASAADVLVIATAPDAHADLVSAGLERGMHVICEKPLTANKAEHELVARSCAAHPDLALVPVHQYRYSPQWTTIAAWARRATRLRLPFSLLVRVERDRIDPTAVSGWRADIAANGGMFADAGVHFLALAWTIGRQLDVLDAARYHDGEDRERATAVLRLGPGRLDLQVWRGAPRRHTHVELRKCGAAVAWSDDEARTRFGKVALSAKRVGALSDRRHVDALCQPLYRDLATRLSDPGWRRRRTAEALAVDAALVSLLEQTPIATVSGA